MKNYELPATDENVINALRSNSLRRNEDVECFYKILQAQNSSSMIALDGRWGSGKTFFVKQLQMMINALNPSCKKNDDLSSVERLFSKLKDDEGDNSLYAVYYDAWENDCDAEPIFSLLYEIAGQLGVNFDIKKFNIYDMATLILKGIIGRNIERMLDVLSSEDPYTEFTKSKDIEQRIIEFLSKISNECANRMVIIIDELDRCKPTFAVQLLEQIKHYLADDRITFVLSVNLEQLQYTIRNYYGSEFDASRYMDRFFDLRITLPPVDLNLFARDKGLDFDDIPGIIAGRFIRKYHLELREIERYYTQLEAAILKANHGKNDGRFMTKEGKGQFVIMCYIVPILIGLKIVDVTKYYAFITGNGLDLLRDFVDAGEDRGILSVLLSKDEYFYENGKKEVITVDKAVERMYNTVFVESNNGFANGSQVGECLFTNSSKHLAIKMANMMSFSADLS